MPTIASLTAQGFALSTDKLEIHGDKHVTLAQMLTSQTLTTCTLTSPTLTTPTLGVASATSINKVAITAPATGATLALADGSTLGTTGAFAVTLAAAANVTITLPSTSATMARTDAANTFTGHQTIEGVTSTGATGTGNFVFATSPTITGMTATTSTVVPTITSITTGVVPVSINRIYKLTHTSAGNCTVGEGSFEGQELEFYSTTAFAHVLDFSGTANGLRNGTATVYVTATCAAQIGASIRIRYVNSRWMVVSSNNVTLA